MTIGRGKYDDVCTAVREETNAALALVIIIEGGRGTGFSVQVAYPALIHTVPKLLEDVAAQIRNDIKTGNA